MISVLLAILCLIALGVSIHKSVLCFEQGSYGWASVWFANFCFILETLSDLAK